ncbi:MAG: ABC transporter ATP-binding protein [Deltaproteobacteria bacterium]|nr:ABC transporter ATP-binding protein [Deltaproteobacteria bacterium]
MRLDNIGFHYGKEWSLMGIDLSLRSGEILGILGPNGSGKSTLLKIMDGIINPIEGEISIDNRPFRDIKRSEFARQVAMVAQENHFRFSFTAAEVALMGRYPHLRRLQFEGIRDMEIAFNALKSTQTLHLADRSIHDLSEGEKQRVFIARALAQEPRIILLDEPTSFLDLKFKREIFMLISTLCREKDISVALVSHDIDLTAQYCHRVVMLKNGQVHAEGPPDEVITVANIEKVYECPVTVDMNPTSGRPRVSII